MVGLQDPGELRLLDAPRQAMEQRARITTPSPSAELGRTFVLISRIRLSCSAVSNRMKPNGKSRPSMSLMRGCSPVVRNSPPRDHPPPCRVNSGTIKCAAIRSCVRFARDSGVKPRILERGVVDVQERLDVFLNRFDPACAGGCERRVARARRTPASCPTTRACRHGQNATRSCDLPNP